MYGWFALYVATDTSQWFTAYPRNLYPAWLKAMSPPVEAPPAPQK